MKAGYVSGVKRTKEKVDQIIYYPLKLVTEVQSDSTLSSKTRFKSVGRNREGKVPRTTVFPKHIREVFKGKIKIGMNVQIDHIDFWVTGDIKSSVNSPILFETPKADLKRQEPPLQGVGNGQQEERPAKIAKTSSSANVEEETAASSSTSTEISAAFAIDGEEF